MLVKKRDRGESGVGSFIPRDCDVLRRGSEAGERLLDLFLQRHGH